MASTPQAARGKRVPGATYRLQFNRGFTFRDAAALVEYLHELGITDCYASPLFKARAESTHGYDVCDFNQLNPNLGTREDFDRFTAALQSHGMGLVVDLVPNHMASDLSNGWWFDVLQNGRESRYASHFDIDWQPLKSDMHDKVMIPILEDHYATVLESGKLKLFFEEGAFLIAYYENKFPVTPKSYKSLLQELGDAVTEEKTLSRLAGNSGDNLSQQQSKLKKLHEKSALFRKGLTTFLEQFNGKAGSPGSFDRLHNLLQQQHYRLAHWKVGPEEINYRRFFDVNELVSVRMELPEVFQAAHQLIFKLVKDGTVTGLRIDHPDGLWNPQQYLERLRENAPLAYVVAEKILTREELLPPNWPVDGTTGYDFLNQVNGLFVQSGNETVFNDIYREFTGSSLDFHSMAYASKKRILEFSLASELNALTHRLKRVAISTRQGLDFTFRQLHAGLAEVIATFPVYRTYITETTHEPSAVEKEQIEAAIADAMARNPKMDHAILNFIKSLLLLRSPTDADDAGKKQSREFVMKFQQLTSPVMAKGLEDTTFYNFNRFVSLNEVGGSPEEFGTSVEKFHQYNLLKQEKWPHSMLSSSTHDTKRAEDVRARINVLSEIPDEWRSAVTRWSKLNADKKTMVNGSPAPHPNDEYLLYQTLVGAWLPEAEILDEQKDFQPRIQAYMYKALRESKAHTSWNDPNPAYENALKEFISKLLDNAPGNAFLKDFRPFQKRIAFFGQFNSLSQILLKMTAPGVPDIYQGTEMLDLSLVDPDNRRPVDFKSRHQLLNELKSRQQGGSGSNSSLKELLPEGNIGKAKLFTTYRTLNFRREHRELFEKGNYVPLTATELGREHVCSFARSHQNSWVITVVPRLVVLLNAGEEQLPLGREVWKNSWLFLPQLKPGEKLRNIFTNAIVTVEDRDGQSGAALGDVLADFPVALLTNVMDPSVV
ncbi:MAG: malto-oligosyltrehalose synthase [Pedosphaera sp.]|nr:malto-oligosyltrehalose synthase [Pedosphaera sp.]